MLIKKNIGLFYYNILLYSKVFRIKHRFYTIRHTSNKLYVRVLSTQLLIAIYALISITWNNIWVQNTILHVKDYSNIHI